MKKPIGTSVTEFFERFPDEGACLEQVVLAKWGDHTPCPSCEQLGWWKPIPGTKKYRHSCNRQHSPLRDTVFYHSNLSLMTFFYGLLLFSNAAFGMRVNFLRRHLGLGMRSTHRLCNRIRLHMATYQRVDSLGGPGKTVHIDEVYLRRIVQPGVDRRKGAIVLGIECEGVVLTGIISDRTRATLIPIIERIVARGTRIVTDSYASYKELDKRGWEHVQINHKRAFHDFHGNTLNPIEQYWSALKRNMKSYGQVADRNLWLFLAEFECRYNLRSESVSCFDQLCAAFPRINPSTLPRLEARFDWRS